MLTDISILLSKPFKFIVGPQKKEFTIHEAAAARLSKPLHNLLHGGMRESKENCVCWEDIDEKTFLRFGEWAYTGDYKSEEPEILLDASQIGTSKNDANKVKVIRISPVAKSLASFQKQGETWHYCAQQQSSSPYNVACQSCRKYFSAAYCYNCRAAQYDTCPQCRTNSIKGAKKRSMIEKFNSNSTYASPITPFTPRKNIESCEDYSEVFLSHARLYVLADKYDIKELRDLSAHKIWVTLKEFTLYPERMGDVVGLVRYSFQNTLEKDKLRTLLKEFCACTVEDLCEGEGFQDLICETPEFACDLIKEMSTRLE